LWFWHQRKIYPCRENVFFVVFYEGECRETHMGREREYLARNSLSSVCFIIF
jgi:hypothetical protein